MGLRFCPDECEFLSLREEEQSDNKVPHICKRFNIRVIHGVVHPRLVMVPECDLVEVPEGAEDSVC